MRYVLFDTIFDHIRWSICNPSFYVTWAQFHSEWVSVLFEFLCCLLSHPFCMGPCVVRVYMSLGFTSVLYRFLCCPSFYVTWSLFRSARVSMFSEFLCHLISLPFCMGHFVLRVSMSLGLTSVMYWSLCCPRFYVTRSFLRSVRVSMLSEFLCHFVSLPFCMGLFVLRVSMSLGLTSVLYGSLCCPSFYVTWSHFRSVRVSMVSEFLSRGFSCLVLFYLYVSDCVTCYGRLFIF